MMGFPTWTLIGMGLSGLAAFLFVLLAYIAYLPNFQLRTGLQRWRLDLRVKSFTGLGLAAMILLLGFFLAGVPLAPLEATPVAQVTLTPAAADVAPADEPTPTFTAAPTRSGGSASGAFGQPPSSVTAGVEEPTPRTGADNVATLEPAEEVEVTAAPTETTAANPSTSVTPTPQQTATNTPTPRPTETPTATITPTPIEKATAVIDTDGSTLWVRRSPGGQQLVIVQDNELVILEEGRANQAGMLWQEVRTVSGVSGWVQAEFLTVTVPADSN